MRLRTVAFFAPQVLRSPPFFSSFLKKWFSYRVPFYFRLSHVQLKDRLQKRLNLYLSLMIGQENGKFGFNMGCKFGLSVVLL